MFWISWENNWKSTDRLNTTINLSELKSIETFQTFYRVNILIYTNDRLKN